MRNGSENPDPRPRLAASVFAIAALVLLLLAAGCTTSPPAPAPATTVPTPIATSMPATTATPPPTIPPDVLQDQAFAAAADLCYNRTPVITNLTTRLEFATCMRAIPLPPGNCAQNYRYYVLKATNEDLTTAGFARQTTTNRLAREAYLRGEGYDGVNQTYVPCGWGTRIPTSIVT